MDELAASGRRGGVGVVPHPRGQKENLIPGVRRSTLSNAGPGKGTAVGPRIFLKASPGLKRVFFLYVAILNL